MQNWLSSNSQLLWALGGVFAALTAGTALRLKALFGKTRRMANQQLAHQRLASLASWWAAAAVLAAATLLGRVAVVILFSLISFIGFAEFTRLVRLAVARHRTAEMAVLRGNGVQRGIALLCYALIGCNYLWILLELPSLHLRFLPLAGLALVTGYYVICGRTDGFVSMASGLFLGLMLTAYCLSHAALLFTLPGDSLGPAEAGGLLIYLVILTEFNDIAQAHSGRRLGKRKITPTVSPHKTWEGFLGGVAATVLLAILLTPLIVPLWQSGSRINLASNAVLPYAFSAFFGLLIAIVGFFGDVIVSAVKRDAGVKDSGTIVPGHGGMLDRVDSLLLTSPLFYYLATAVLI